MDIKDQLFNDFLSAWKDQLAQFRAILFYLNTYPEELNQIKQFHWTKLENIEKEQLEWLWLISQFGNSIDTAYFKPWWIPVNALEYDQFIDLSSPTFELFQVEYSFIEPYHWFKYPLVRNIPEFMISVDCNSEFITREKENTAIVQQKIIAGLCSNHKINRLEDLAEFKTGGFSIGSVFPDDLNIEPFFE